MKFKILSPTKKCNRSECLDFKYLLIFLVHIIVALDSKIWLNNPEMVISCGNIQRIQFSITNIKYGKTKDFKQFENLEEEHCRRQT